MPVTRSGKSSIATLTISTNKSNKNNKTSTKTSTSPSTSTPILTPPKTSVATKKGKKQGRKMENEVDEKQTKRSKTKDEKELVTMELSNQGIPKDVAGLITELSVSPAVTAFHQLIEYCIKHQPSDANIQLDPVTEEELKIVEDRLGYTLPDDLRSIYLIHRNALCDHSFSRIDLIPRFSTLLNPDLKAKDCDYKEISPDVVHFADHHEQNTWKLYHTKYGCIMQYCEEPDMDYPPRMLWFSITHLLLSYVQMIHTFAPYWWDDKKYVKKDSEKYHEWEEKQREIICQTDEGTDYDTNLLEIMESDGDDADDMSWKTVIDEYLQQEKQHKNQKRTPSSKKYLISWEADMWTQQHRVYDESWDLSCDENDEEQYITWNGTRDRMRELREALDAINYKEC